MRHLKTHGNEAVADEADAAGRKIGQVLSQHVKTHGADLLVMGAYGRARIREFILGGATASMLRSSEVTLFLSH